MVAQERFKEHEVHSPSGDRQPSGYLDRKRFDDAQEILPTLIDRRFILRGINGGSKADMDDLCTALTATKIKLDDIMDSSWASDNADKTLQYLWEGKQVGKLVIEI
ncbi:MAG: hypothetical protein Q9180_004441 [Flavoplaca navasiana]